jgi:hypothetical protein
VILHVSENREMEGRLFFIDCFELSILHQRYSNDSLRVLLSRPLVKIPLESLAEILA